MSGGTATRRKALRGLEDRSCRPHRCPARPRPVVERRIVTLRQKPGTRSRPHRRHRGHARLDRAPGPRPPRAQPARRSRPDDQGPDPPLRDDPTRRARPRRHQEAGPDPEGWWLAGPRALPGTPRRPRPGRLRLRPLGDRRLHPPGLLRSAGRTSRERPPPTSGDELDASSPTMASPSNGCSPTMARAIGQMTSPTLSSSPDTASPGPIGPRPMARPSGSTGPSWRNGPTSRPGRQRANATDDLPTGSTSTTIIDTTPPSEAHR